jgi:NADP-reducing hydrogenase subunit HndC
MGATLRQIIFDIGGGIPRGRKFKAAQMGGPSGGCVPARHLDLPLDYDSVRQVGAIMGSGGLIVMDESTCMVDIAQFFTDFCQKESCGKCIPCRIGTHRMLQVLERITAGEGRMEDLDLLEALGATIKETSLCGLGQTAPNPVLSTLHHFRDEYAAHVEAQRCPAGVCTALVSLNIDEKICRACGRCVKVCPAEAITGGQQKVPARIDAEKCICCKACMEVCSFDAIRVT